MPVHFTAPAGKGFVVEEVFMEVVVSTEVVGMGGVEMYDASLARPRLASPIEDRGRLVYGPR